MRIKHFILFSALFLGIKLGAQEGTRPLTANLTGFHQTPSGPVQPDVAARRSQTLALQLPFKDDFFYAHSNKYPASHLWADSNTFVNTGYPIAPPSLGVATFDGLNKHGYPHEPGLLNLNASRPADTLTSRPINLRVAGTQTLLPSDSIALVFYYQARGNGDNPEVTDSLIVDLYNPSDSTWNSRVWFSAGNSNSNTNDTSFKRAFIRIDNASYLREGFKFRFRNSATTAGDFDHWHVDYVHLDKGLYASAPVYDDVTFAYVPTSLLIGYSSMPWRQYKGSEMTNQMRNWIKNNASIVRFITYKHTVYDKDNNALHVYNGGAGNLIPFADSGYSRLTQHANINVSQHYSLSPLADTADFRIEHVISRTQGGSGDYSPRNDTVQQYQLFRNYYAYDDGSAEGGYYVNGVGAMMAIRIQLFEPDTFRALRIYFDPVGRMSSAVAHAFRINVWSAEVNGPGQVLYALDSVYKQKYLTTGFKSFPEYGLSAPVVLQPGTYYIGLQQQGTSTVVVGLDRNYDNRTATYFNTGSGWQQSSQKGSLLMRPVFGAKRIPLGLPESNTAASFNIYPNPASEQFTIMAETGTEFDYSIIDALGSVQVRGSGQGMANVDTASLPRGIYFVKLTGKHGEKYITRKLIISR